jgi:membrane-associated phospholipid phosphatase
MTQFCPTLPPLTTGPGPKRLSGAAFVAICSVLGVVFLDPIHEFYMVEDVLVWVGDKFKVDELFTAAEPLGGYVGLFAIVWAICAVAGRQRAYVGSLLVALILSGLIVGVMKEGLGRARPDYSVLVDEERHRAKEREMMAISDEHPHLGIIRKETGGVENQGIWLLWNRPIDMIGMNRFASYPSGHANQVFVMAVFFTAFFRKKGMVLWYVLAVGCALSRVRYERHFPTDVLLGSAIGYITAYYVLSWQWPISLGAKVFRVPPLDTELIETPDPSPK